MRHSVQYHRGFFSEGILRAGSESAASYTAGMRGMAPGRKSALLSMGVHAAVIVVLALIVRVHGPVMAPEHLPGTAQGTVLMFNYQLLGAPPGSTTAKAREQAKGPALPRAGEEPDRQGEAVDAGGDE